MNKIDINNTELIKHENKYKNYEKNNITKLNLKKYKNLINLLKQQIENKKNLFNKKNKNTLICDDSFYFVNSSGNCWDISLELIFFFGDKTKLITHNNLLNNSSHQLLNNLLKKEIKKILPEYFFLEFNYNNNLKKEYEDIIINYLNILRDRINFLKKNKSTLSRKKYFESVNNECGIKLTNIAYNLFYDKIYKCDSGNPYIIFFTINLLSILLFDNLININRINYKNIDEEIKDKLNDTIGISCISKHGNDKIHHITSLYTCNNVLKFYNDNVKIIKNFNWNKFLIRINSLNNAIKNNSIDNYTLHHGIMTDKLQNKYHYLITPYIKCSKDNHEYAYIFDETDDKFITVKEDSLKEIINNMKNMKKDKEIFIKYEIYDFIFLLINNNKNNNYVDIFKKNNKIYYLTNLLYNISKYNDNNINNFINDYYNNNIENIIDDIFDCLIKIESLIKISSYFKLLNIIYNYKNFFSYVSDNIDYVYVINKFYSKSIYINVNVNINDINIINDFYLKNLLIIFILNINHYSENYNELDEDILSKFNYNFKLLFEKFNYLLINESRLSKNNFLNFLNFIHDSEYYKKYIISDNNVSNYFNSLLIKLKNINNNS